MSTNTKATEAVSSAMQGFRDEVTSEYQIEEDFADKICELFELHATPLTEFSQKRKNTGAKNGSNKPRRKKSAYNIFVRDQMATDVIKVTKHKEKMAKIAELWKSITDEEKVTYQESADVENAATVAVPKVELEVPTTVEAEVEAEESK